MSRECSYLGHLTRNWYTHPLDQQCVSFGGLWDVVCSIRKKHTDRVFLSSACVPLDQRCVSFERLWAVGSAHYPDHFVSHTTLYIAHLSDMFGTQCVLILYTKHSDSPSYSLTVHLIRRLSGATVGLYDGETVCFVLSTNHPVHRPYTKHSDSPHIVLRCIWYKAFGFPSYSPEFLEHSYIKGLIHYYTSPTTSL